MTQWDSGAPDAVLKQLASLRVRLDECDNPFSAHLDAARQTELQQLLLARGDDLLPALEQALSSAAPALRREGVDLLARLPLTPAVVGALRQAMHNQDPEVRRWACDRLQTHGDVELYAELARLLDDSAPKVARLAVDVLFSLDPVSALADVAPLAKHPAPEVRATVAARLRTFGGEAQIPSLVAMTGDSDHRVRRDAIAGLIRISPEAAHDALMERYRDASDLSVREDALAALAGFAFDRTHPWRVVLSESGDPLAPSIRGLESEIRRFIVIGLADAAARDEVAAALDGAEGTFAGSGGKALLSRLATAPAGTPRRMDRVGALFEAALIPRSQALEAAREGLEGAAEDSVLLASKLAGLLADPSLAPALARTRLRGEGEAEARRALVAIGPRALPAMAAALLDAPDSTARFAATRRLVDCRIEGTGAHLASLLLDRRTPHRASLFVPLEQVGDTAAAEALRSVALDASDPLWQQAALSAATIGDHAVVPALEALVMGLDEKVAAPALGALVRLNGVTRRVADAVAEWSVSTEHPPLQVAVVRAAEVLRDPRLRSALQRYARGGHIDLLRTEATRVLETLGWA